MPYFQERPMRHIFLVEVSSWSENQNSLKEKLTEKRHLAMLEIYGIVLPWIRWAQWKGLKQELQQILLHGIIRYMDWIWLNTKGRGVKPCEMYSRGMKQHTIRTVIFLATLRLKKNGLWHWLPSIPVKWNTRIRFVLHWEPPSAVEPASSTRVFPGGLCALCTEIGQAIEGADLWKMWGGDRAYFWTRDILVKVLPLVISKYFEATSILSNDLTPKSIMENHTKSWKSKPSQVKTSECTSSSSHRKPFNMDNECKFVKQNHTERLSSLLLFAPGSLIPGAWPFSPQPSALSPPHKLMVVIYRENDGYKRPFIADGQRRLKSLGMEVTRKGITNPVGFFVMWGKVIQKSHSSREVYIVHSNAYLRAFRDNVWSTLSGQPLKVTLCELTWQLKSPAFSRRYIFKRSIFCFYVSSLEGKDDLKVTETFAKPQDFST